VFRRRRRDDADQAAAGDPGPADTGEGWAGPDEAGDWDAGPGEDEAAPGPGEPGLRRGPWDAADAYPERDRADFGSLLVPVVPMQQIELATDGERFIWVTVKNGASELRVHAFAAPRSGGLWQEVRQEIAEELSAAGTGAAEAEGPFGTEVFAHVPVEPGNAAAGTRPVRFVGVDGPRCRREWRRARRAIRGPAQRRCGGARRSSDAAAGHAGAAAAAGNTAGAGAAGRRAGRAAGGGEPVRHRPQPVRARAGVHGNALRPV